LLTQAKKNEPRPEPVGPQPALGGTDRRGEPRATRAFSDRWGFPAVTVRRPRPWEVGHSLLRSMLSVTPRHEFVELCDLVVGDPSENIRQPCLWIDAVELGGLDQGIGDGS